MPPSEEPTAPSVAEPRDGYSEITAAMPKLVDPIEAFRLRCEARAYLFSIGELDLHQSIDQLQFHAERNGLVELIGQDAVQAIMGEAFAPYREPAN